MRKYFQIIKTEFQRQLTYRAEFIGYRLSHVVEIAAQLVVWTVIFRQVEVVRGYSYEEMATYVVVGWIFLMLTATYGLESHVARDIHRGQLSNFILKPLSYIRYTAVLSLGRSSIATFTGLVMFVILAVFMGDKLLLPDNYWYLPLIASMLALGYLIRVLISVLIGFIAFWTTEINGIYNFFWVLQKFLSGGYFPINLLPSVLVSVSLAFPFVYTYFVPVQLYLGKMTAAQGLKGIGLEIIWLIVLYAIIKIVWKSGLKKYESVGI
jgi:ABC-2 type transport system permease protein